MTATLSPAVLDWMIVAEQVFAAQALKGHEDGCHCLRCHDMRWWNRASEAERIATARRNCGEAGKIDTLQQAPGS